MRLNGTYGREKADALGFVLIIRRLLDAFIFNSPHDLSGNTKTG